MKERLGNAFPDFLRSYSYPPCRGLRVNTLKISADEFAALSPYPLGERIPWERDGFYIGEEKFGSDPLHSAGLYYLQEPSAMLAAAGKGERVLDLCAAPGGKTTQLAAHMKGSGVLISNEVDFARAKILSQNTERMGVRNGAVTSASPERLLGLFPAFFDYILVDAPCSGEGMFKKEPNAAAEWSPEKVLGCAARQRSILDCADGMLAVGGTLVYSTCTFAEEEDEGQIENFLARHPRYVLESEEKLYPHERRGEGHYCARLVKREGEFCPARPYPVRRSSHANDAFYGFAEETLGTIPTGEITTLPDGRMYLVPAGMPDCSGARLLRLGVELGEWDGKRFKPAHALAMACGAGAKRSVRLGRAEAERYLRGEMVGTDEGDGWCVVCVGEFPLGFGKCVDGTIKNHYPKGLRNR